MGRVSHKEETAYREAMHALTLLMELNPAKGDSAGVLLAGLAAAVDDYEQMRFPIGNPTPEEAAAFRREQEQASPLDRETRSRLGYSRAGKVKW